MPVGRRVKIGSDNRAFHYLSGIGFLPCPEGKLEWLLLDSRVVHLPRSSHLIVVTLFSSKPLFFSGLKKSLALRGQR
jgi:hypothetical protein